MKHAVAGYKLGRNTAHRRAMFRNMAISLFTHGQITTTGPKARAVRPFVEKLITLAKKGDLASRRRALQKIGNEILVEEPIDWEEPPSRADGYRVNKSSEKLLHGPRVIQKLFGEIGPRYVDRPGGYTRIIKLAARRIGDGSDLVVLQLVGEDEQHKHRSRSKRRQIQDKRTAFAAKLRKGDGEAAPAKAPVESEKPADEPAPAAEAGAATEAPAEEKKED